jgi:hypothetical protein
VPCAEDKGDHCLCNGTKIWTTRAQWADWIFCLARTTPGRKPEEGISFILIDMKTPWDLGAGPIVTVETARRRTSRRSNQVFFDNVKVLKENLIGKQDEGWTYAEVPARVRARQCLCLGPQAVVEEGARASPRSRGSTVARCSMTPTSGASSTRFRSRSTRSDYTEMRFFSRMSAGQRPGASSSLFKTRGTELAAGDSRSWPSRAIQYSSMPFVQAPWEKRTSPGPSPTMP